MEKVKNEPVYPVEQIPVNPKEEKTSDIKITWIDKILNRKKLKNADTIAVLYVRINGNAEIIYKEPKFGMFEIDGRTYHVLEDCRLSLRKDKDTIPLCVLFEKSLTPLTRQEYEGQSMQEKLAELQDLVIRAIKSAELVKLEGEKKPGMNPKTMIIIAIIAIIGFAFYKQYGG